MLRIALITAGIFVVIFNHYVMPVPVHWQQAVFLSGIVVLGIPHGAADMLVAAQNEVNKQKPFSTLQFLVKYIARLALFGILSWLFPVAGILFFIVFAAYHFGETDLFFLKTEYWPGKLLVMSYGLVILTVILFHNLSDLQELLYKSGAEWVIKLIAGWSVQYRLAVLSVALLFFFSSIFLYFLVIKNAEAMPDVFLLQFAVLVFILYNLPLVAGFTFYFVVWHAVLSLRNIIVYLRSGRRISYAVIVKQISLYSVLAMAGIIISGTAGLLLLNRQGAMMYVFAGLAVLTAPHMQVMHHMYSQLRSRKKNAQQL